MRKIRFELSIAPDRFLAYYNGEIRQVQVTSLDGEIVRFPAHALRPFLQHNGISGLFEIAFDCRNRLVYLERAGL
jgi:hypothetical protein